MRTEENKTFAAQHHLSETELELKLKNWKQVLLKERETRIPPGLDDKILTSWNAMTISGLISSYKAFGDPDYLALALSNAKFLKQKLMDKDGRLFHSYQNNQAKISGFLEDYAFTIEAFTAIFEATGQREWLDTAQQLTEITFREFFDEQQSVFYFTGHSQTDLIARTIEIQDNVIPSSNSVMAKNLFRLSFILDRPDYLKISQKMLDLVHGNMIDYPSGYSNWSQLMLNLTGNHFELAIVGENATNLLNEFQKHYLPNVIFCAGTTENGLPLLQYRYVQGKTLIYVCQDKSCMLPVETVEEALGLIQKK